MKRIIASLLAILLVVTSQRMCYAESCQNEEMNHSHYLYGMSSVSNDHKAYALSNFSSIMSLYEGFYEGEIRLEEGITIYNDDGYEKTLFPVWNGGRIIAAYLVVTKDDNEISGYLTGYYVDALNELTALTSQDTPLEVFSNHKGIFGKVGDRIFNLEDGDYAHVEHDVGSRHSGSYIIVHEYIDYCGEVTRTRNSYIKPFTIYQKQNEDYYCLSYATYNILKNLGYSYTLVQCKAPLIIHMGGGTPQIMQNWLTNEGFTAYSSNSGSLSVSQIRTVLTTNHSYVCASATYSSNSGHAFVVYGANTAGYLYIWDVRSSSKTISSDLTHFPGSDSNIYTWDHGYYYLDIDWD